MSSKNLHLTQIGISSFLNVYFEGYNIVFIF